MITRKLPSPHICLRCRHALTKRSSPAPVTQLRYASDRSSESKYLPSTKEELERDNYRNRSHRRESGFSGDGTTASSFVKLYGHHGQARRAALEDLNTQSLNDPAKAIVLRDTIFNFYTYDKLALEPKLAEHIDIEQQLSAERGLVGQEEVNENITSLRPKLGDGPSSWDEINALVRQLQDGFTTSQLERYIELHRQGAADTADSPLEKIRKPSIVRTTKWLPGTPENENAFNTDPLRGYFLESHTGKHRTVLRLLRHCWNVELPELAEGMGQFEIEVKANDLDLLLLGSPSALDKVCRQDLTFEHEKVEVFRQRNTLRVTTVQHKRRWIISEIEKLLSNVSRTIINLKDVLLPDTLAQPNHGSLNAQQVDQSLIDELSRLTRSTITRKDDRTIEVSYIKIRDDQQMTSASKLENVRRLLVASVHAPNRVETQLVHSTSTTPGTALVKCPPSLTLQLPWFKRCRDWSRWTAPIGTVSTSESQSSQDTSAMKLEKSEGPIPNLDISAESISGKPEETVPNEDHDWIQQYFTETSALVGTILHKDTVCEDRSTWAPRTTEELSEKEHTFSSNVPNVSRILSGNGIQVAGRVSNHLILRFVPDPFSKPESSKNVCQQLTKSTSYLLSVALTSLPETQLTVIPQHKEVKDTRPVGSQVFSVFPPIEMRFCVDAETRETQLEDVRALVHESRTDVMLPANLVDTRFEQLTFSCLKHHNLEQLHEYVNASTFILTDGIVKAADTIKFPISDHLIQNSGTKFQGTSDSNKEEEGEIDYRFAGLEIRSSVSYIWNGWLLEYISIRAGRAAGSRSELRLRPIRNNELVSKDEFARAAYRLADLVGGGDLENATDLVPKFNKSTHTSSKGYSLIRQIETKKGVETATADYRVKRVVLDVVHTEESKALIDREAGAGSFIETAVRDYEENEGEVKEMRDEVVLTDSSLGQRLEGEDGRSYHGSEQARGAPGGDDDDGLGSVETDIEDNSRTRRPVDSADGRQMPIDGNEIGRDSHLVDEGTIGFDELTEETMVEATQNDVDLSMEAERYEEQIPTGTTPNSEVAEIDTPEIEAQESTRHQETMKQGAVDVVKSISENKSL